MKKLTAGIFSGIGYLITTATVFAQAGANESIRIQRPQLNGQNVGYGNLGDFINKTITLAFIIGVIAVLVMLVWGAIQWMFSGGQKEAVQAARERIIHALIGLAVLAVAFALAKVTGQFLGFDITQNLTIPTPAP